MTLTPDSADGFLVRRALHFHVVAVAVSLKDVVRVCVNQRHLARFGLTLAAGDVWLTELPLPV